MRRRRNVLTVDAAGALKLKLRAKADALEQRTGERVTMASIARRLLFVAIENKAVCRQAGVP